MMTNNDRSDEKAVNIFLVCLAKEILRIETGFYYDVVNKYTVSWYIYKVNKSMELDHDYDVHGYFTIVYKSLLDGRKTFQDYNPKKKTFPPKFSTFSRYMWEKMDDFVFSRSRLNKLVSGISTFGRYDTWDDFERKYQDHDGKIWADNLIGTFYNELNNQQILDLQHFCGNTLRNEYSKIKFSGNLPIYPPEKMLEHTIKTTVFHDYQYCLRVTTKSELKKIKHLLFNSGVIIRHDDDRMNYFSYKPNSFFIVENLANQIVGSICIQAYQTKDFVNPNFHVSQRSPQGANSYLIREIFFSTTSVRDFILNNLQTLIIKMSNEKSIDDHLSGSLEKNVYIYSTSKLSYVLADFGFMMIKEMSDGTFLYMTTMRDLLTNSIINHIDRH